MNRNRAAAGRANRRWRAGWARAIALACPAALADPGYYVVTVYNDPGKLVADYRYWLVNRPNRDTRTWPELGVGWHVSGRWYSELLASFIGSSRGATSLSSLNWQNDLLLTDGQHDLDVALHTQWIKPMDGRAGHWWEFGPVLQTDIGRSQINLNLFAQRGFGALASEATQLKYQWQLRHRWRPGWHLGAQGFGELGPWQSWSPRSAQSHRLGPAVFGSLGAGPGQLSWQAAWPLGSTYGQPGRMFKLQLKYTD